MNREEIYTHFDERFEKQLWVPDSWLPHIWECHIKLKAIDANYVIHQIKEKFNGLRYYFTASNDYSQELMQEIVDRYEKDSYTWGGTNEHP
jgi:hypothetical protein